MFKFINILVIFILFKVSNKIRGTGTLTLLCHKMYNVILE